ncbi:ABC transporter ATP-binding protein [Rhizobiales bacterium]|uniref:ABC transporter ATP-binding protein n=1 Tax=Hongsoonwoonella zoysiae TaxID=2821844 RepID=UPI00155F738B|nr:ABC transporter ATP-binding protein [Hongsoonwoonella zoysiae]NRG16218.1 ABC transporter ATP-binding protein [Hongsoonwoonella zoysiae]
MNREKILSVEDLSVRFKSDEGIVNAVSDVSFELAHGEALGILGESGSGKSVTLRTIIGLLPRNRTDIRGRVRFDGREIQDLSNDEMNAIRGARIAMVFQEPMVAFDPVFTVGEQIAETIVRHDGSSWADANRRALDLLELVQIPSAKRRLASYPHEMSGGMLQRSMIALALSCGPQLLLADEPTTALDVSVQIQIILLLRELQRELGMSVILVTHDVGVAAEISDRLAVMYAGRIVETGTAAEMIEAPCHPYTDGLLSSTVLNATKGKKLNAIPGAPPDLIALPRECSFAPRCRHVQQQCLSGIPRLEPFGKGRATRCLRVSEGQLELQSANPAL